jgi:hypothetical protein
LEKWDGAQRKKAMDWTEGGNREDLNYLPKAEGKLRNKMLSDLNDDISETKVTPSRLNPITGTKEYLLHRTTHVDDDRHHKNSKNKSLTSWTWDPTFANHWVNASDDPSMEQTMSAWIPEHHIHSYMPTITRTEGGKDFGYEDYKDEGEVMVEPHDIIPHKTKRYGPPASVRPLDNEF